MRHLIYILMMIAAVSLNSCKREPPLHLYDGGNMETEIPFVDLDLEAYWNYGLIFNVEYDWKAEWHYGWDSQDISLFGNIGYTEPSAYDLRRYYTGNTPYAQHTTVNSEYITQKYFHGKYEWGYWDILVWNGINTPDGVQNINFDEVTSLDSVTAYTNPSMRASRYQAPKYTHAFYEPEQLFSAYQQAIDIDEQLHGFEFDSTRNAWVKKLNMILEPVTYIYLTQVILHHNNGRITGVDGIANLSGMARTTNLNTGRAGNDPVTVTYNVRFKTNCDMNEEKVDIAGGRLLTFGICDLAANRVRTIADIIDKYPHYMDVTMQFLNGMDSTFVFDVTDQVRRRFKGGVLTVELDMDTIPTPSRKGGSAFDAIVKDYEDGGTHEFEM